MTDTTNRVAIVGMACRYPGANNLEEYARLIDERREVLRQFSDDELRASGIPDELIANPDYVKIGSLIDDPDQFAASFFAYSPSQASLIDPQQRLFLETAWLALEHAACDPYRYKGRIAVFAGTDVSEYFLNNLMPRRWELERRYGFDLLVASNDKDSLTTRVSYKLNLRGPSVQVSTNCSTSLVATWLGWQSLVDYQSDMALVGGVYCPPGQRGHMYVKGAHYSRDGRCRPFDAKSQGIRVGSGVGVVVLKRLEEALADGDQIFAVICGAAVNHDGADKVGYTAPSVHGQAEVIAEALAIAGFGAETIGYVEAHGTATPLGDPVEVAALTKAYRATTAKKQYCRIGSVKANIGHSMNAAGVAGLIKATLALHRRQLPASINFESPNPAIDFTNSPFYVGTEAAAWPQSSTPRRAGVSAFGLGGTNAHVVLEEAPALVSTSPSHRAHHILAVSAKTESALDRASENLVRHLTARGESSLADVSYTLLTGRAVFEHRRVVLTKSTSELLAAVQRRDERRVVTARATDRTVALVFPGADSDSIVSTKAIYDSEPVFRQEVDQCAAALARHLGVDVRAALYRNESLADKDARVLAQAVTFVSGFALGKLLLAWGVEPRALLAWGVGEYAAGCVAGVITLEEAASGLAALLLHKAAAGGAFARAQLKPPEIPLVDENGTWLAPERATDHTYWDRRLVEKTSLESRWNALRGDAAWIALALGPVVQAPEAPLLLPCVDRTTDNQDDAELLLMSIARLWALGGKLDWQQFFAGETRRRLALPGYPFERVRCWIDPPVVAAPSATAAAAAPVAAPVTAETTSLNEIEREIAVMWKEILGVAPASGSDDFLKLGGDSLMVSRLVARVREKYEIDVSMEAFLQASTLADMAAVVARELVKDIGEEELAELLRAAQAEGDDG